MTSKNETLEKAAHAFLAQAANLPHDSALRTYYQNLARELRELKDGA